MTKSFNSLAHPELRGSFQIERHPEPQDNFDISNWPIVTTIYSEFMGQGRFTAVKYIVATPEGFRRVSDPFFT